MSTVSIPPEVKGVARFSTRCDCGVNNWTAVDHGFGFGIGWACLDCGTEDDSLPRVGVPERTEEDL